MIINMALGRALVPGALLAFAVGAHATVLTFDKEDGGWFNGEGLPEGYGSRVESAVQDGFVYGSDFGFTPNVEVTFGAAMNARVWTTGYGSLENVVYFSGTPNKFINFTADEGWFVRLHHFDIAGWPSINRNTQFIVEVDGQVAFDSNVTAPGQGFARLGEDQFWQGTNIRISVPDNRDWFNVGVDNIAFSQQPIPEPATMIGLALGAGLLAARRRRRSA